LSHTFVVKDINNPLDAFLETFAADTSQITSIQAGRGELNARFSETNYQFVDRVSIFMIDSENPNIRKEIYYLDFNNDSSNDQTLRLLTGLSDVEDILKKDTFHMEIKLTFRSFSPTFIENRLIFELQVFE